MNIIYRGNKKEWLRSLKVGDTGWGFFPAIGELESLNVSITKFNRGEGNSKGVYVRRLFNWRAGTARIIAISLQEVEDYEKRVKYAREWKKRLPPEPIEGHNAL